MVTVNQVRDSIGMTYPVAAELVKFMEANGLLIETTGRSRNRVFAYRPYLALLGEDPLLRRHVSEPAGDANKGEA